MERHFDESLDKLNADILKMASLTEEAIHHSIDALASMNKDLALKTIIDDQKIDDMENTIEEESIDMLALFQPMAKDLRFITTAMRINTELERIADLTVNICQRTLELSEKPQPLVKPLHDIPQLANIAKRMVRTSIDAFVQHDEEKAREVIFSDKAANALRTAIITELIDDFMVKDGTLAPKAVPLILVARDLERICDQATNIAEDVIYMVHAKVVKHHRELLANE